MFHLSRNFMLMLWCGLMMTVPCLAQPRIIGGDPVGEDRFPYFALLRISFTQSGRQLISQCGGTLITSQTILTAAHCLDIKGISSITATLDFYSLDNDPTSVRVAGKSWSLHPSYDAVNIRNDIGIITLETAVSISPIQLSFEDGFPVSGTKTKVIGFGATSGISQQGSRELLEVDLMVKSNNECKSFYSTVSTKLQICAGEFLGKNPCFGDSGGPMIVEAGGSRKQDTIAGLVSFGGTGCFLFPAVFTRVSAYKDWIVQQACQGSNGLPDWCSNGVGNTVTPATPSPNIRPSTPRPTRLPPSSIGNPGCFAASTTVEVLGRGSVPMKDLVQGDLVLTENGKYEPIYTFGHYAPDTVASFLDVRTTISTLRLTKHHMVYINQQGQPIAASQLSVGDLLRTVASETGEPILAIRGVREKGLYAPFTPSGKIVVNGIIASVYMTVLGERTIDLGWTHISPHWMSHSILFPHRFLCYHIKTCSNETFTQEGINTWHAVLFQAFQRVLKLGYVMKMTIFHLLLFLATSACLVESSLHIVSWITVFVITYLFAVSSRRLVKK